MLFPTAAANVRFPRIPGFSFALGGARVNQDLLVSAATRKPSAMTIHSSVIRVSLRKREECLPRRSEA